jgi:regulator of PEP synthase PpsR (kinase-PPPase family)
LETFIHQETDDVVFSICSEANALSKFTSGKKQNEWKLDYLKQHLKQKVHVDSVIKLQNLKKGGIVQILTETQEDRKLRVEVTECKKTNADMVKVLIDNVILAIKMNASMLSVQDIHDHLATYTTIPESWCSKNL